MLCYLCKFDQQLHLLDMLINLTLIGYWGHAMVFRHSVYNDQILLRVHFALLKPPPHVTRCCLIKFRLIFEPIILVYHFIALFFSLSLLLVSLFVESVFASLPQMERGVSKVIGGDPKGNNFLYTNGKSVIIRNIEVIFHPLLLNYYYYIFDHLLLYTWKCIK